MLTKVHLFKAMVFPVVMYGCESWAITKAVCWIIDAFELWCLRRLLKVPWTARRSNQSILKKGTGKPGVLQSTESRRVGHAWVTELNWTSPGTYSSTVTFWLTLVFVIVWTERLCFFLLLVSAPSGWGWSNRLMQASSWVELLPAQWCVELRLVPLVGSAMLRKTLSSLLVDGGALSPACWLFCLRHPSTAVEWG